MKRKLSSDLTLLYKSLWMIFAVGLGGMLVTTDMPSSGKAAYFFFWIIGIIVIWGLCSNLRIVVVDNSFMYVSDSKQTTIIPISEIKGVQQIILFRLPVIIVELKKRTKFGPEIRFVPYTAFRVPFTQHPVVDELKRLAHLSVK
jgi:hypothetical protein